MKPNMDIIWGDVPPAEGWRVDEFDTVVIIKQSGVRGCAIVSIIQAGLEISLYPDTPRNRHYYPDACIVCDEKPGWGHRVVELLLKEYQATELVLHFYAERLSRDPQDDFAYRVLLTFPESAASKFLTGEWQGPFVVDDGYFEANALLPLLKEGYIGVAWQHKDEASGRFINKISWCPETEQIVIEGDNSLLDWVYKLQEGA